MIYEKKRVIEGIGQKFGFLTSYMIFSTILFFILGALHKIPETWTFFHVLVITFILVAAGMIIKKWIQ